MHDREAQQLQPGALLAVRECMLDEDPDGDVSLRDVVAKDGYIYKFKTYLEDETYPVQATSLATGKMMEFYAAEVEAVKEQDDGVL